MVLLMRVLTKDAGWHDLDAPEFKDIVAVMPVFKTRLAAKLFVKRCLKERPADARITEIPYLVDKKTGEEVEI